MESGEEDAVEPGTSVNGGVDKLRNYLGLWVAIDPAREIRASGADCGEVLRAAWAQGARASLRSPKPVRGRRKVKLGYPEFGLAGVDPISIWRPILRVRLHGPAGSVALDMLVDSGSDETEVPLSLIEALPSDVFGLPALHGPPVRPRCIRGVEYIEGRCERDHSSHIS
jgi:hypothetical protein